MHSYKCDFELTVFNVLNKVYPKTILSGCHLHYSKAIWKNADKQNLTESKEGRNFTRLFATLPLLSANKIKDCSNTILADATIPPEVEAFSKYYMHDYLEPPIMASPARSVCPHCPWSSRFFAVPRDLNVHVSRMHKNVPPAPQAASQDPPSQSASELGDLPFLRR